MAHIHTRGKLLIGLMAGCFAAALQMTPISASAADTQASAAPIYGSQLMTDKERTEFRARMWAAQTAEERERIRAEHHVEMQKRAQERGVTLPEMPPAMPRGGGMGPGGMRSGMGTGMGAGMGTGRGPCAANAASGAPAGCPAAGTNRRGSGSRMMNR